MAYVPLDQEQSEGLVMLTVIQFGIGCTIVGVLLTAGIMLGLTLPRARNIEEFEKERAIREARLRLIQKMAVWK